ncbi:hypothetical protein AAFX91_03690 [Bradyrhizobium sp. 31Argb]|uniref:hypothetical protein n=1 Tax=unclassified Bradyrhizobium TaxID=2631580 RepID=UPI00102E95A0|nr:hypothetical protein [Bradyrhizobium sp. Leo170]TAI67832.1 hypothetical protein CWO89_00460 [Bradyrhizobium sp. Leo170]
MFVPSAVSLLNALKIDYATFENGGRVEIPAGLFKLLLQIALASADFDEDGYLRENPDVAKALGSGEIESAHVHFIGFGYFEGRHGGGPEVDEDWYTQKYPDVAAAVREGKIKSAKQHFHLIGGAEGRSPNLDQEENAAQWKKALRS